MKNKKELRQKRKLRIRAKIYGTADRPRLAVFRSNRSLSVQVIDDAAGKTLIARKIAQKNQAAGTKLGQEMAKAALDKKINRVVFDRGGYRFHGVIKAIADAAREGGLKF